MDSEIVMLQILFQSNRYPVIKLPSSPLSRAHVIHKIPAFLFLHDLLSNHSTTLRRWWFRRSTLARWVGGGSLKELGEV